MNDKPLAPRRERFPSFFGGDLFTSLQREIDSVFDRFQTGFGAAPMPRVDAHETDKEIEITAELPGLQEKDVDISLSGDVLTIRGEKKSEREEKKGEALISERSYGSFSRSLRLPAGTDSKAIKASLANGVLKVTIPKPATAAVKKIEVKGG